MFVVDDGHGNSKLLAKRLHRLQGNDAVPGAVDHHDALRRGHAVDLLDLIGVVKGRGEMGLVNRSAQIGDLAKRLCDVFSSKA
ncbi:MAG: hypothetical protein ACNA8W_07960 [Bradymonadaceae bacterium]